DPSTRVVAGNDNGSSRRRGRGGGRPQWHPATEGHRGSRPAGLMSVRDGDRDASVGASKERDSMREKLEGFKRSRAGQFVQKIQDDRAPNLAILLAWGTLNTLLPLTLGILAISGFVLRDPERMNQLTNVVFSALPSEAAQTLQGILTST